MNRHELKRALKRITANTKRLAKLTAPKPKRRRAFYVPPRASEPVVEPCFAMPPTPPVRAVVAKAPEAPAVLPPNRTTRQPAPSESILAPPESCRDGFKSRSLKGSSPKPKPTTSPVVPPTGGSMPPRNFVGSCTAVCALTALKCRLPAHGPTQQHKSERGPFVLVATPGQTTFAHRDELDAAALAGRRESDPDEAASGRYATAKKAREKYRRKHRTGPKVSAHLGHATTAGNNEKASDLRRGA